MPIEVNAISRERKIEEENAKNKYSALFGYRRRSETGCKNKITRQRAVW